MGRIINSGEIVDAVAELCIRANYHLPPDVRRALEEGLAKEVCPTGREVLQQILANADIAAGEQVPICQDTGVAVVFLELGQEVAVRGGYLYEAVNQGVRKGYTLGYLRKSMVSHPLRRQNTGDNTPAVIHTRIVPGNQLKITLAPKGGGSENMSAVAMLTPAAGAEGVKRFVVDTVRKSGPNPCPPIIVGVGIGGNLEKVALMAKEALLRPLGEPSPLPDIARMEREILEDTRDLGIGPQGFGGRITALAVHIEVFPCHIASLPVAVNINCHAARHESLTL